MPDIVFPKKNESKFIDIAERLYTKELCFIYPFQSITKDQKHKIKELQKTTKVKVSYGILAKPNEINKAKNTINFVITESSEKNQHVLESLKPNILFNLEISGRQDKTHYRISGLNQVLCNLATKKHTTIGFSFSTLLNSTPERRAILLGRMIQNIKFCKKYKVNTLFASFAKKPSEMRAEKDLNALENILNKKR